jgi:ribosomal protein S18 acetylase RimI-like enzyme
MEAVVALDAAIVGHPRHLYYQRRLKAALAQTERHVQFSAEQDGRFVGFIKARKQLGEFGRARSALLLEAVGDAAGFELSQNMMLDCAIRQNRVAAHEGDKTLAPGHLAAHSATEVNYGAAAANDFDALSSGDVDVRALEAGDLDDLVRIDQRLTGRRREAYIREVVAEAMSDSGVRLSMVARVDGIAAGFVTARADFGDYGRVQPVAVLDTIGVDPDYAHRGVGHALLQQLFANLNALNVDRVETVVARENFELLGFFYDISFEQSQRLSFDKRLR